MGSAIEEITRNNVEAVAKLEASAKESRPYSEKFADAGAKFVGSWTFLTLQSSLILAWIGLSVYGWSGNWDPYPFTLLNLVLSFEAAFATPLILISENRRTRLAERRNHLDLQINLLSEQENTEQLRLLQLLCKHAGIEVTTKLHGFMSAANLNSIVEQIEDFESR